MNDLLNLLRQYDEDAYNQLKAMLSEQETIEKHIIASAPSYNQGLLSAAEEHLRFLGSIANFFNFDGSVSELFQNKAQSAEFDVLIAKKRIAEQKARESLRTQKSPSQLLYQKLSYEFNQFQLGLQSLDETSAHIGKLTEGIKENDLELINIRDSFFTKINYVREQSEKETARKVQDLELSLLRKVQFYRSGMLKYNEYISALNSYITAGESAKASGSTDELSQAQISTGNSAQLLLNQLDHAREKKIQKVHEEEIKSQLRISEAKLGIITNEEQRILAQIELSYQKKRSVIELEIKDEAEKAAIISQLNRALHHELEEARLKQSLGFQSFLAVSKSTFSSLWDHLIIGQRQAKDEWDALWLDMKNSALKRLYELLENELMDYFLDLFINFGFGDVGTFLFSPSAPASGLPISPYEFIVAPSFSGGGLVNDYQTERLIKRLDNLETAILGKSWQIQGEDIHTVNRLVENRRTSNAL